MQYKNPNQISRDFNKSIGFKPRQKALDQTDPLSIILNSISVGTVSNFVHKDLISLGGSAWGWKGENPGDVGGQDYDIPFRLEFSVDDTLKNYTVAYSWEQTLTPHDTQFAGPTPIVGLTGRKDLRDNAAAYGGPYPVALMYLGNIGTDPIDGDTNSGAWRYKRFVQESGIFITEDDDSIHWEFDPSAVPTPNYQHIFNSGSGFLTQRDGIKLRLPLFATDSGGDNSTQIAINGLTTYGTANQIPGVNAGASAWEYKTLVEGSGIEITHDVGSITLTCTVSGGVTDHGALSGLGDDDHSIYALLAGRSGGQSLIGGTAASENLTLRSTSHATRGKVRFGSAATTVYDEVNDRIGIGTSSPSSPLHIISSTGPQLTIGQATTPRLEVSVDSSGGTVLSFAGSAPYMTINKPLGFNQATPGVDLFSTLGWSRAAALQDGHAFVFKNSSTPWALGATGGVLYFMTSTADSAAGTGTYQGNWSTNGLAIGMGGSFSNRKLEVRSTSAQIRGSYDATNYWEIGCDLNGNLSITGGGTAANGINIGRGSGTPGASSTILGTSATAAGASSVAVGRLASAAGGSAIAIGLAASTGSNNGAICIGESASNTGGNSVAIGRSATAAANEFVSGNTTYFISNVYFGSGALSATPVNYTLNGSGGSGTNIAGGTLNIGGGKGTGTGAPGVINLQVSTTGVSGTTLQTLATKMSIAEALITNSVKTLFSGEIEIDGALNHDGTHVGLYSATPVVQSTGWSVANPTTRKAIDVTALTHGELCEFVGTLTQRLLDLGVIAA